MAVSIAGSPQVAITPPAGFINIDRWEAEILNWIEDMATNAVLNIIGNMFGGWLRGLRLLV